MRRLSVRRVLRPGLAIVAGFAMLAIAMATGGVAQASQGEVGGRPAYPKADNPRTSEIYIHTLNRGASAKDGAVIVNNTDDEKIVKLYATDGILSNTGAVTCKQEVEDRVGVGSWVTLDSNEITLAPRSSQTVDFTVAVPSNADVGEHNGCIVYQVKNQDPIVRGNVTIQTRSATRLAVTVPGALNKSIAIAKFTVEHKAPNQLYHVTVENTGNVSADTEVAVTLSGLFGGQFYKNQERYPVLPNSKVYVTYTNDKLPVWGGGTGRRQKLLTILVLDSLAQLMFQNMWWKRRTDAHLCLLCHTSLFFLDCLRLFLCCSLFSSLSFIDARRKKMPYATGHDIQSRLAKRSSRLPTSKVSSGKSLRVSIVSRRRTR